MFKKEKTIVPPPVEVVTTLQDLMRFEFLVQSGRLLPNHPVYSILAGPHASKLRGRGLDFEEVRLYTPGDDIRNIDWRVTARTGATYSKVFNEEKERPSFIVVDQSRSMFFGSKRFVKSVSAAHAAALGAFYTLKRGDRIGGLIFNDETFDYLPPKRSKSLVQHFLQCIVNKNSKLPSRTSIHSNTKQLNEMLKKTLSMITHDYVITIISDFTAMNDETRQYLKSMRNHNDVILVQIYDPMDLLLPEGKLLLSEGEHQLVWNNNHKSWGAKYKNSFEDWKKKMSTEFRHYGIPVVFLSTETPVEEQIMKSMIQTALR